MKRSIMAASLLVALAFGLFLSGSSFAAAQDDSGPDGGFIGIFGAGADDADETDGGALDTDFITDFIGSAAADDDEAATGGGVDDTAATDASSEAVTSMPSTGSGPSATMSISLSVLTLALAAAVAASLGTRSAVRVRATARR